MSGTLFLMILIAYLLGSIPFGYILARIYKIDIRKSGSGNIGATNVLRTLGPAAGGAVLILDILKGTLAVFLMQQVTSDPWLIIFAGLASVLGHTFPIFLKFRGGRGSATGLGILLGIAPDIFAGACLLVVAIVLLTGYVSVASIVTAVAVASAFIILQRPLPYTLVISAIALLLIIRHIPNIKRLINRTEPKVKLKK